MKRGFTHLDMVVNIRFPSPRAHGLQVAAMAEALSSTGLNVSVVVPRRFPYQDLDVHEYYGVRRTFRVERIASLDTIDMVPPRLQRVPFLLQSATFGWRALARAAVQRRSALLVRDHYTLDLLVSGLRRRHVARLAAEVHNLPETPARRRWVMSALRRLPAVITITDALREELVGEGIDPASVLVARDGVHLHRFADLPDAATARAHLGLPPDQPLVVYAGQLYAWKGVDTLVQAMEGLPDVRLLVVGGDKVNLERVVGLADRRAPGRVTFTGTIPSTAVPFHLAAASVVALPNTARETISARYTSPLKLFEAMATGRPIVASDLPSLREVLTDDHNARLVAPDDPEALAAGIRGLVDDPDWAARLSAQAREDVAPYDWSDRGRRVARFLRDTLQVARA